RRVGTVAIRQSASIDAGCGEVETVTRIDHAGDAGEALVMVEVERCRVGTGREESTGDAVEAIGVVQRNVHVTRDGPSRTDLHHAFDSGDPDASDVHRRQNGCARDGGVIDTRAAPLVVGGKLGDDTGWKAVHVPHFVEVVALREGRLSGDAALGRASNGTEVLDIRRQEQPTVV